MDAIWFELVIVLLLILANGFFAGAELAIVSARRGRIAQMAAEGDQRAIVLEKLSADPHRFLATVQIGVTLVGTMASAVGGAAAVEVIKPILQEVPLRFVNTSAEPLALVIVVGVIAYLSLILGELVPKALALEHSERIALAVARPINFFARIGGFAVFILTVSSRTVLALLGIKAKGGRAFITKEEIQHLVSEGRNLGVISLREQELIRNVFEFSQTKVREVMVPRPRIVGIDLARSREDILKLIYDNQYSRYPIYKGDVENILGFIHAKDLLCQAVQGPHYDLESLIRPALVVPESKNINELLREMQRRHVHMAVVIDEYGGLSGIVTTEDLLEELVGEIEDEHDEGMQQRIQRFKDGSYLVDGFLSLNDLGELLGVRFPESRPFETLAGLILFELGHLPEKDEQLLWGNYRFTCVKVRQNAIRQVKIEPKGLPNQAWDTTKNQK